VARLADRLEAIALAHAPHAVATMGVIDVKEASINVVPGLVHFTIDLRDPSDHVLDAMEAEIQKALGEIGARNGVTLAIDRFWNAAPLPFDPVCVDAVRQAAAKSGFTTRDCTSGASHDAAYMQSIVPSAMIFVPSKDGLSHNELEYSSLEDCGAGAQVLLDAVLLMDEAGH